MMLYKLKKTQVGKALRTKTASGAICAWVVKRWGVIADDGKSDKIIKVLQSEEKSLNRWKQKNVYFRRRPFDGD